MVLPPITREGVVLGSAVLAAGIAVSLVLRYLLRRVMLWRGRSPSAAVVFSRIGGWVLVILAAAAASTIVFPSVRPVDLLGGVGVISIAAGIAFQTVLGNMFAGIVLLSRDQFRVGDQIAVSEQQGTVVSIGLTSTSVRTFDGRLVLVPNGVLHSSIITVQTGYEQVRSTVGIDLGVDTDLDLACRLAETEMQAVPQVLAEPAPVALLTSVGAATVCVELRFWSGARQLETREAQHAVISAVMAGFRRAGIAISSETRVLEAGASLRAAMTDHRPDGAHPRDRR